MASRFASYRLVAIRCLITFTCLAAVLVLFELFLRRTYMHVTLQRRDSAGGLIESNPAFLYKHEGQGRRMLPNSRVVIHNHYVSHRNVRVETNSLGFRSPEIPLKKPDAELRILILGDSITVADSLDLEQVFSFRLEERLRQSNPEKALRVINAGVGNIGTKEQIDILQEQGLKVSPDWVVVAFYLNDSRPSWGFSEEVSHRGWLRRHSLIVEALYQKMLLADWLKKTGPEALQWVGADRALNWREDPKEFMQLTEMARYDWGAAWQPSSWKIIEPEFTRLAQLSLIHGFRVLLAALPVSFQVYADFVEDSPQKQLALLASRFEFSFLDLLPVLRQHRQEELFYDQCHLRPLGHEIVAEELAGFFQPCL